MVLLLLRISRVLVAFLVMVERLLVLKKPLQGTYIELRLSIYDVIYRLVQFSIKLENKCRY